MKNRHVFLWLVAAVCFISFSTGKERSVHIFMAGDSTMADKPLYKSVEHPVSGLLVPEAFPERGWGQLLPEYFGPGVVIKNFAKNGRSTRTFIEQGWWAKIMEGVQKGDYVIIQFGHNDSSESKPDRYTSPADYKKNLVRFVEDVRSKGGNPVICTSVVRRKFDGKGDFQDSHEVYVNLAKEVAREKNVPLIDMYASTKNLVVHAGPEASKEYFLHLSAEVNRNFPEGVTDNTHFVRAGANAVAGLFVEEIEQQKIQGLTKFLKKNIPGYVSEVWVSDLGNGKYKNPVLYADYSDPDVCRVGEDYYMTASSFNCIPGLQILHSKDLINWTIIGAAIPRLVPEEVFSIIQHGNGVWAPAIRYHNGEFYIYYGDPDFGIYMTKTTDPAGEWEPLTLVKAGKGLIDSCPFWDEDGQAYLVHAYAGSRAGMKSVLALTRMTPDGKQAIGESRIIYDGHEIDPTIEGPKIYKRNGYYYIFAPAGGVATGWQVVLRSENIFGPYERKMVMAQGDTPINGPHQGAWVDTTTGEDWFIHFQDAYAFGRVVHLQPMKWVEDWPVIGIDKKGNGWGEPVLTYTKPNVGKTYPIVTPVESDEFSANELGWQWQWHANPVDWWYFTNEEKGVLSLYSVPLPEHYKNLWDIPNLLLQKMPATDFTATAKITFVPSAQIKGERAGFIVMGLDYALLSLENTEQGLVLSQNECKKADKGNPEKVNSSVHPENNTIYLRVKVKPDASCAFSYSLDGNKYQFLGNSFTAKEGKWIGAKIGFFCSRPVTNNDGGRIDIDWFRIEK